MSAPTAVNRILIKPAKRLFSKRQQWVFELRAANGEKVDPRDTIFNQDELVETMLGFFRDDPLELVIYDRHGNVESRDMLRKSDQQLVTEAQENMRRLRKGPL